VSGKMSNGRQNVEHAILRRGIVAELGKLEPHVDTLRLLSKGVSAPTGPLASKLAKTCCGIVYALLTIELDKPATKDSEA
jgi:hypothetical protein